MAKLDDVAKDLNIDIAIKQPTTVSNVKAVGHKRRSWLEAEDLSINIADTQESSASSQSTLNNKSLINEIEELHTNYTQTTHKLHTNLTQEPNTNQTQTVHSSLINKPNSTQTKHKLNTQPDTQKTQSTHKVDTNLTQTTHISVLAGLQRRILLFLFEECKKARSHTTEPLSITYISNSLEITLGSIKTSIARLCEKEFLKVVSYKNGRGGWSTYAIPEWVYKELLQMETQHKLHTNYTQSRHKVDTQPNTQPNTNTPSSSSFKDLKTTTTNSSPDEWDIDITAYEKFGFRQSHLKQLAQLDVITVSEVEQSLIEFNFDFENGSLPPIKIGKINLLMGLFRAGNVYVSEGYKNEQQAMNTIMIERAKKKRQEALDEQFLVWEANLSTEERSQIMKQMPPHLMVLNHVQGIDALEVKEWFMGYFQKLNSNVLRES